MNQPRSISPFTYLISLLSGLALLSAIGLSISYKNTDNPSNVNFLLRPDTYNKIFPFFLTTVAVGGFGLVYKVEKEAKEKRLAQRKATEVLMGQKIQRLQAVYETVLDCFQTVRLQRRRLRSAFVPGEKKGTWKMRRSLFEDIVGLLNEAQVDGERIVKTLDFEKDNLESESNIYPTETKRIAKLRKDLKSQVGGIQGILRNVLRAVEWQGLTSGTTNDEDLINMPEALITFASSNDSGNLSFRKISEHHDAFSRVILGRIKELEADLVSYDQAE